jgi:hypothetical protein
MAVNPCRRFLVDNEEFSSTLEEISTDVVVREAAASDFQAIQNFKSLPDFLMFPVFLALRFVCLIVAVTPG